jgi:hypothetical protein
MWVFEIVSGRLYDDKGEHVGTGYSGKGDSKNNPAAQSLHNEGPIPVGLYTVGIPVNTIMHGPYVLPLTPDTHNLMWGRFGFLMHGDSLVVPGSASEGCVIMSRDVREKVWKSMDRTLEVIAQKEQ